MNILVTGSTGFIGFHLTKKLVNKGHKIRCLIRNNQHNQELKKLGVEIFLADIEKKDTLIGAMKGIDTVYHLAGGGNVAATFKKGYKKLRTLNVDGVKNLLEFCAKEKVKNFVFFSSISAMGIIVEKQINENTTLEPKTPHEVYKHYGESLIKKYKNKINYWIIRPGIVYGPRAPKSEILLLAKLIKKGLLFIPGNGKNLMPFIHVDDLVNAVILLTENEKTINEEYLIVNEKEPSFNELAHEIKEQVNKKAKIVHIPKKLFIFISQLSEGLGAILGIDTPLNKRRAVSMTSNRLYDISKLKKTGWKQKVFLKEGITSAIKWYKQQKML